jgi:hypothetical protein
MMMVGSWRTRTSPKKNNNGVALKKVNKVKFLSKSLAKEGSVRKEKKSFDGSPITRSRGVLETSSASRFEPNANIFIL